MWKFDGSPEEGAAKALYSAILAGYGRPGIASRWWLASLPPNLPEGQPASYRESKLTII